MNQDILSQDAPVLIRGSVSGRDRDEDAPPIFLDGVVLLGSVRNAGQLAVEVTLTGNPGMRSRLPRKSSPRTRATRRFTCTGRPRSRRTEPAPTPSRRKARAV